MVTAGFSLAPLLLFCPNLLAGPLTLPPSVLTTAFPILSQDTPHGHTPAPEPRQFCTPGN